MTWAKHYRLLTIRIWALLPAYLTHPLPTVREFDSCVGPSVHRWCRRACVVVVRMTAPVAQIVANIYDICKCRYAWRVRFQRARAPARVCVYVYLTFGWSFVHQLLEQTMDGYDVSIPFVIQSCCSNNCRISRLY